MLLLSWALLLLVQRPACLPPLTNVLREVGFLQRGYGTGPLAMVVVKDPVSASPRDRHPRACGDPVRRGFSVQLPPPLGYWTVRSSRTMTAVECVKNMPSQSRGVFRPSFAKNFLALSIRGRGEAGRPMRPIAACAWVVGRRHTRWSGHTGITRHSPRNGLRLIRALLGEPCAFATVIRAALSSNLTPALGVSGPHDFAVHFRRPGQERHPRPPHPRPASVTLRNAPLSGTGWRLI
jgi:hypothetical protein